MYLVCVCVCVQARAQFSLGRARDGLIIYFQITLCVCVSTCYSSMAGLIIDCHISVCVCVIERECVCVCTPDVTTVHATLSKLSTVDTNISLCLKEKTDRLVATSYFGFCLIV